LHITNLLLEKYPAIFAAHAADTVACAMVHEAGQTESAFKATQKMLNIIENFKTGN